jgi:hypothetical protein
VLCTRSKHGVVDETTLYGNAMYEREIENSTRRKYQVAKSK